jgi:hypothetical protein
MSRKSLTLLFSITPNLDVEMPLRLPFIPFSGAFLRGRRRYSRRISEEVSVRDDEYGK